MIAHIEGEVLHRGVAYAIIVASGIGYKIFMIPADIETLVTGETVCLWTHLAVRETAHDLYGFADKDTLNFFELLLGVSGIGPKSALAILSTADIETLRSAISQSNPPYLTKVAGIGKKTAKKIVLELSEKVGAAESPSGALREHEDALEALRAMGYSLTEARDALKRIPADVEKSSERLREALKILGRSRP